MLSCRSVMFGRSSIRLVLSTVSIVHRSARFAHRPVKLVTCSAGFVRRSVKLGRCSARLSCRSVVLVHRSIRFVLNTIGYVRCSACLAPCLDYFACSSGALGRCFAIFLRLPKRCGNIQQIPEYVALCNIITRSSCEWNKPVKSMSADNPNASCYRKNTALKFPDLTGLCYIYSIKR